MVSKPCTISARPLSFAVPTRVARPVPARLAPVSALPGTSSLPEIPGSKSDLPGYIALAGFAVQELSKSRFAMTPDLLYASLAVYSLVYTGLSLAEGKVRPLKIFYIFRTHFLPQPLRVLVTRHVLPAPAHSPSPTTPLFACSSSLTASPT